MPSRGLLPGLSDLVMASRPTVRRRPLHRRCCPVLWVLGPTTENSQITGRPPSAFNRYAGKANSGNQTLLNDSKEGD